VILLYFVNVIAFLLWASLNVFIKVIGSTTIPCLIFVLPGFFYYSYSKQFISEKDNHRIGALIFGIFGLIQIIAYTTISLYGIAIGYGIDCLD
jgi:putative Ca2+/H+ antiporter (TMEM165/GDT1 family)